MRYFEVKEAAGELLAQTPDGLIWAELRQRLELQYKRPCST